MEVVVKLHMIAICKALKTTYEVYDLNSGHDQSMLLVLAVEPSAGPAVSSTLEDWDSLRKYSSMLRVVLRWKQWIETWCAFFA